MWIVRNLSGKVSIFVDVLLPCVHCSALEICTGMGVTGIPREWVQLLREYCGMEFVTARYPREVFGKCATIGIYDG